MILLKNINKSFDTRPVLCNFSYSFERVGLYVIFGESGAGKTTLLRIISGLDKDFTGYAELPTRVSYAFQEHRLFDSLSALDNVALAAFKEADDAATRKSKEMLLSLGFNENELNLMPSELSGGMRQRVSIARALLFDAPVLLLDEPTKELDPTLCDSVYALIEKEASKRTVILVSHDERAKTLNDATLIEINSIRE